MPLECPVCRQPMSRLRTLVRTAWSRWRCPGCDSLLGISFARRMLATIPWVGVILLGLFVLRIQRWGVTVPVTLMIVTGLSIYMAFERLIVYERCGFRCKGCGYDLRGQVEPCCPECGRVFDDDEIERMKLARPEEVVQVERSGRTRRWVMVAAAVLTGLLVFGHGLHLYLRSSRDTPLRETQRVVNSVLLCARDNAGQAPRHALEHSSGDTLLFVAWDSATAPAGVPVPGGNLITFDRQTHKQRADTTRKAIEALPRRTIAHRLGDFVFTYHGIDCNDVDPGLWVVVRWLDPAQNPPPAGSEQIGVGLVDGTVTLIRAVNFPQALIDQNVLRAEHSLPALPHPATVTHAAPAVAQP